jgi:hypothetical protein
MHSLSRLIPTYRGLHSLTRDNVCKQPENIQFPMEMSRRFLAYGDRLKLRLGLDVSAPNPSIGLPLRITYRWVHGLCVRLGSPLCQGRDSTSS